MEWRFWKVFEKLVADILEATSNDFRNSYNDNGRLYYSKFVWFKIQFSFFLFAFEIFEFRWYISVDDCFLKGLA
jgi:hypothetical protein